MVAHDNLYVADSGTVGSGNGRVWVLRLPSLEVRAVWRLLLEPIGLAADSQGRIYVLDRGEMGCGVSIAGACWMKVTP